MNEIRVLDKGFVGLVEHAGGDASVIRAARVSHGEESKGEEADRKLIKYMLSHEHGTPFEHNMFTFHVKAPLFVLRQWHRHRIGVSYNELSARYEQTEGEFYVPEKWRLQGGENKQGSVAAGWTEYVHLGSSSELLRHCRLAFEEYERMISIGIAREMARMILPVNLYSEMYFTCNARSLMAFIKLRSEKHAQWEMRQYSNALWQHFAGQMPWTADAFLDTLDLQRYAATDGLPGPCRADVANGAAR